VEHRDRDVAVPDDFEFAGQQFGSRADANPVAHRRETCGEIRKKCDLRRENGCREANARGWTLGERAALLCHASALTYLVSRLTAHTSPATRTSDRCAWECQTARRHTETVCNGRCGDIRAVRTRRSVRRARRSRSFPSLYISIPRAPVVRPPPACACRRRRPASSA